MALSRKSAQVGEKWKLKMIELKAEVMKITKQSMSERELTNRWAEVTDTDDLVRKILNMNQDHFIKFDGKRK